MPIPELVLLAIREDNLSIKAELFIVNVRQGCRTGVIEWETNQKTVFPAPGLPKHSKNGDDPVPSIQARSASLPSDFWQLPSSRLDLAASF